MKTIIKILICLSLIYTPMFANAANVGGWNLSNGVAQGASTIYDASKNVVINGKNYIKDSWVKITPNASQVAKVLARGGAGLALSVAVEQLIGSVDWVLDPANNSIRYWQPTDPTYIYVYNVPINGAMKRIQGAATACQAYTDSVISRGDWVSIKKSNNIVAQDGSSVTCQGTAIRPDGTEYGYRTTIHRVQIIEGGEQEEKTLPLEVVAQQVISNAESGDQSAQVATTAAASDIVAEAETDETKARPIASQADANAETRPADPDAAAGANSGSATATPQADPVTGEKAPPTDISLEFPVFCNWAPTVCEAAQVVISFPQTLTGWWESANQKADDWATSISEAYQDFTKDDELPNDDTKLDVSELPTPELQENAISWGAACPADVSIPISMQGVSSTLVFSWGPWCQLLSIIKPAIIASAYIGAAFIVLGLRT